MSRQVKSPGRIACAAVNWQASRIGDPVQRLKFLRKAVGDRQPFSPEVIAQSGVWRNNRGKFAVAGVLLLAWPAIQVSQGVGVLFRAPAAVSAASNDAGTFPTVWMLESGDGSEVWSNGLRIERRYETVNEPSRFEAYPLDPGKPPVEMSAPVGIVYHTTESHLAPLEESQSKRLKVIGASLLGLIQENRSYHYVIDRFGRVWRVVRETDEANHAGNSIWADSNYSYLNLNRGFLGVSVETQTAASGEESPATPAQVHSLKVLTEMLRSKYRIVAGNCVTHAQVSVNPSNNQVGYHYDWAAKFPYLQAGLPDNYATPIPAIWLYGFTYDPLLVNVTGSRYWQGLLKAESRLREDATAHGARPEAYRKALSQRYVALFAQMKLKVEASAETRQGANKESMR